MPCLQAIDLHSRRHFLFFRYVVLYQYYFTGCICTTISDKPKNHKFPPPKTIYAWYVAHWLRKKCLELETKKNATVKQMDTKIQHDFDNLGLFGILTLVMLIIVLQFLPIYFYYLGTLCIIFEIQIDHLLFLRSDDIIRSLEQNGRLLNKLAILF